MPDSDPIHIRLAVAVDQHGGIFAVAVTAYTSDAQAMLDAASDCDGDPIARAFVEADVPRTPTVQGRVIESEAKL